MVQIHPPQNPFDSSRFEDWFVGIEQKALRVGDYSVFGLEDLCVVERKDLPDLVHSFTVERAVFVERLRLMWRWSDQKPTALWTRSRSQRSRNRLFGGVQKLKGLRK